MAVSLKKNDENSAVAVVPQMIQIDSSTVMLQPRTLMLFDTAGRPEYFYLEPAKPKRAADEDNGKNQIERGVHQIDPNRLVSHCCVMPSMVMLRETGNPYPINGECRETIVTNDKWRKYVPLMHAVWGVLKSAAGPMTGNELADDAVAISKYAMADLTPGQLAETYRVIVDCLRDLRMFGLATSEDAGMAFKKTKFQAVIDPSAVAFR